MRKKHGKCRTVPPSEWVIGIWKMHFFSPLCTGLCICVLVFHFLSGGVGAKLTSFQSSVDWISELSHQSRSTVSWSSTLSPPFCSICPSQVRHAAISTCSLWYSQSYSPVCQHVVMLSHCPGLFGRQASSHLSWPISHGARECSELCSVYRPGCKYLCRQGGFFLLGVGVLAGG